MKIKYQILTVIPRPLFNFKILPNKISNDTQYLFIIFILVYHFYSNFKKLQTTITQGNIQSESNQQTSKLIDENTSEKSDTKQLKNKLFPQDTTESKGRRRVAKKLKTSTTTSVSLDQEIVGAFNLSNETASEENSQVTPKRSFISIKNIFKDSSREDDSSRSRVTLVPLNSILINEKLNTGTADLFIFILVIFSCLQ
jgi:hypothetical protein